MAVGVNSGCCLKSKCIYFIQWYSYVLCYFIIKHNSGILDPSREQPNQNEKRWKLQTRFYWVCAWEIMKSTTVTSLTPPSTGLISIQFRTLTIILVSLIPMDQKKYNTDTKSIVEYVTYKNKQVTIVFHTHFYILKLWNFVSRDLFSFNVAFIKVALCAIFLAKVGL